MNKKQILEIKNTLYKITQKKKEEKSDFKLIIWPI